MRTLMLGAFLLLAGCHRPRLAPESVRRDFPPLALEKVVIHFGNESKRELNLFPYVWADGGDAEAGGAFVLGPVGQTTGQQAATEIDLAPFQDVRATMAIRRQDRPLTWIEGGVPSSDYSIKVAQSAGADKGAGMLTFIRFTDSELKTGLTTPISIVFKQSDVEVRQGTETKRYKYNSVKSGPKG